MRLLNRRLAPVAVVLALAFGVAPAAFGGKVRLSATLEATNHPTGLDIDGDGVPGNGFGVWEGRSNLGPVSDQTWVELAPWDEATFCGPTHVQIEYRYAENVLRFVDGSRIFLEFSSGSVCFNFADGSYESKGTCAIVGGTGRFAGASGNLDFELSGIGLPHGLSVFTFKWKGVIATP